MRFPVLWLAMAWTAGHVMFAHAEGHSISRDEPRFAIGPRKPPAGKACTNPHAGSLVTDDHSAAYLQTCSQEVPGYPTTLKLVDFTGKRPETFSYQLKVNGPKLLSMQAGHIRWVEIGPDPIRILGDHLRLVEFDTETGGVRLVHDIRLPFVASLNTLKRGDGCWMAQLSKGPPAEHATALVLAKADGFTHVEASQDEWPLFWDPAGGGFVVSKATASAAHTMNCEGKTAPLSAAAKSVLSDRPALDRRYSLPDMSMIAMDPLGDAAEALLLAAADRSGDERAYRTIERFGSIHGLAGRPASDDIAVMTGKTIEVFHAGTKVHSIDISAASGWSTQIEFLKGRPALVVLDDLGVSVVDLRD